jgi:hypothetical protein
LIILISCAGQSSICILHPILRQTRVQPPSQGQGNRLFNFQVLSPTYSRLDKLSVQCSLRLRLGVPEKDWPLGKYFAKNLEGEKWNGRKGRNINGNLKLKG